MPRMVLFGAVWVLTSIVSAMGSVLDCDDPTVCSCDDGISCTHDTKDSHGCDNTPDDARCNDGRFCNGQEFCNIGADPATNPTGCDVLPPPVCLPGLFCSAVLDRCVACDSDLQCSDNFFCNGFETCNDKNECQPNFPPCPGLFCDEANDRCFECFNNSQCDDDMACTVDTCVNGACEHEKVTECCLIDLDCVTTDPCAMGVCVNHVCEEVHVPGCCEIDADCNDGNSCTLDVCVSGSCRHSEVSDCCRRDAECSDGDACTVDRCLNFRCRRLPIADCCRSDLDCEDGDSCTVDSCDETIGLCRHEDQDEDDDGVCDAEDACPESNMADTIVIGTCDSGVANLVLDDGCTMADRITDCASDESNLSSVMLCVMQLTRDWESDELITDAEKRKIQGCLLRIRNIRALQLR